MATLGPEIAAQLVAVSQKNAGEVAGALSRTFGGKFEVPADGVQLEELPAGAEDFDGAGLVCLFTLDDTSALAFFPHSSGMMPDWYATPDASGSNKLFTLALELGMVLLPEEFMPRDNKAQRVGSFLDSIKAAEIAPDAGVVSLQVKSGDRTAKLWVVWPVGKPENVFLPPPVVSSEVAPEADVPLHEPGPAVGPREKTPLPTRATPRFSYETVEDGLRLLPPYTRSLLKVKVPVVVTLASRKQSVREVLDIVPGSILQFEKSCEEPLTIEVGNQAIAQGECVKVGDMFGLRVTSIILPDERFLAVRGQRDSTVEN